MLQRYLGNKNVLIEPIIKIISDLAEPGDLICDAFSGSLAVSIALKKNGYRVAANDVNLLSWIYGTAYLLNSNLPKVVLDELFDGFEDRRISGATGKKTSRFRTQQWRYLLANIDAPYQNDVPRSERRSDLFHHYCEQGSRSNYKSSRGSTGRRRFFSASNARRIDRALSRIRWWWQSDLIGDEIRCLLTACLLDAIEKVSNTQGTYHDFPREFYDPRSLKPIEIKLPKVDLMKGRSDHMIGKSKDSLEFILQVPKHRVLYLDPPYNFRQYTAYYFLPNLVASYCEIDDLDTYFNDIQHVRGQNMSDDFTSTFCSAKAFMPSLRKLVERSKTKFVVMSYFDGKNHWSDFKSEADHQGRLEIERFFSSDMFVSGTMTCLPLDRLNYQSYGGYEARMVKEFLFVAEKRDNVTEVEDSEIRLGLG
jgi:adenine-specific DNA methylase